MVERPLPVALLIELRIMREAELDGATDNLPGLDQPAAASAMVSICSGLNQRLSASMERIIRPLSR